MSVTKELQSPASRVILELLCVCGEIESKGWHILGKCSFIIIIMYLYSAQYLHILQDSKCYLTNPTVQVQPQLTSN